VRCCESTTVAARAVKTLAFRVRTAVRRQAPSPGVHLALEAAHQAIAAVLTDADGKVYRGESRTLSRRNPAR